VARNVTIRFIGKDELSPVAQKIGNNMSGLGKQLGSASSEASSSTGIFSKLGSAIGGMATVAGGIIAANIFGNLVTGLKDFAAAGLQAVGETQMLEQRLNSLFAANLMYEQQTVTTTEAITKSAEAIAKEREEMERNVAKRDTLAAKIQEQRQRVIDLTAAWGEQGLATKTAQAKLGEMEVQLSQLDAEIARGVSSVDDFVTITQTQWVPTGKDLAQTQAEARVEAEKLLKGIEALVKVSPFPTTEIQTIGAYGVQMGMTADEALEFTTTMTNLGLALGLPAHEVVRMSQNLKQMQGMSKLTTIDMREMERRGFDLAKVLQIEMGMSVEEFNAELARSPEKFNELISAINTFSQNTFGDVITQMNQTLPAMYGRLKDTFVLGARDLLRPIVEAVTPFASDFIDEFDSQMTTLMPAIGEQIAGYLVTGLQLGQTGQLGPAIAQILSDGWTNYVLPVLQTWTETFFQWVVTTVQELPTQLSTLVSGITEYFSGSGAELQTSVHTWVQAFWSWVQEAGAQLGQVLGALLGQIFNWASSGETQTQLNEMGFVLGQRLVDGLAQLVEDQAALIDIMSKLVAGLGIAVGAIGGALIMVGGQIVAGIISGILEKLGVDLKPALVSDLGNIFSGMAENIKIIAKVIGTNIVEGIKTGITDAKDKVTTAITDIATGALDTIKDVLGIGSPAKAFIDIGLNIMEGLAGGITENIGKVLGALGSVGKSLLGGLFGGDDEGSSLDLGDLLMNLVTGIPEAIENLKIGFTELWTILNEQVVGLVIEQALVPLVALLVQLYTVHIPTLQTVWTAANEAITSSTFPVHDAIRLIITLLGQASQAVKQLALDFKAAMDDIADSMEDAADGIGELVDRIDEATEAFRKMAEAAKEAAGASEAAGSTAPGGAGFQHGTGLSGFRVPGPGGRPFPLTVHGGEMVEVMPAGAARQARRSGDGGGNTWNVTINATESVGGVQHSLMTLMALVGSSSG